MRVLISGFLAFAVLPLFAAPILAAEQPAAKPLVTKVFSVADLVVPIPDLSIPPKESNWNAPTLTDNAEHLMKMVTSLVRPASWTAHGGTGTTEFFETGCALVVVNSAEVIDEVAKLLKSLSRLQGTTAVTEVRILKAPVGFRERLGLKIADDTVLTEREVDALLNQTQQVEGVSVTQAPKVTTFDGQVATIRTGERRLFVTGLEAVKLNGETVYVPQNKPVDLGDTINLCARILADGKSVSLRASFSRTRLIDNKVEMVPVITHVTPIFEGGSQGKPVPFTQHLQVPDLKTDKVEKTVTVPTGGTIVLGSWTEPGDALPLSKNPYVNRLVKNPARHLMCEVVVLATVCVNHSEESAVAPVPRQVENAVYQLRNAAAADAADAVQKFLAGQHEKALLVAEPISNTILVSAEPAVRQRVVKLLTALDAAPPQVQLEAMVLRVQRGFLADIGLTDVATEPAIALTPRELSMFNSAIRKEKSNGTIDILSRPQILVTDNQTGRVRMGGEDVMPSGMEIVDGPSGPVLSMKMQKIDTGLHLAMTPRIAPDGKSIMLRANVSWTEVGDFAVMTQFTVPPEVTGLKEAIKIPIGNRAVNVETFETTVQMKDGETVIMRGLSSVKEAVDKQRASGAKSELVIVLTPHCVRAQAPAPTPAVQPAGYTGATSQPAPLVVPSPGVVTVPRR